MALLSAIGVSLPNAGLTIIPRTVIVSIVVGTIVAVVAAIIPARRAANVPPVAAMREDMAILQRSLRRRTVSGAVVGVIGVILLGIGLFGHPSNPAASVGAGAALTFLAVAMLSPWVVVPLSRILGAPLATVQGIAGKLGRENAIRNPRRTASTAAALTVGLALVSVVATLASSVTASTGHLIDRTIKADYIVASSDFAPFSPTVARRLAAAPGIAAASPLREGTWHDGTAGKTLTAVDPATARDVLNLTMTSGSFDALARGELLISDKSAKSHHVAVGGTLPMGFTDTGVQHLTVGGTFSSSDTGFVDSYVVSLAVYDRNYTNPQDLAVLVKTSLPPSQAQAAVAGAVSDFPNVSVKDQRQFKDSYKRRIGTVLNIVYVLLAFSVLIAIVGIVNTLALSVIERTRELGLLRAVGMVRRQVRRMVRGEAILVSLIGAILGVVVGEALAIALLHALHSTGLTAIAIPWGTLIGVVILGAVAGVFAAIWPARRAARLDVLAAIATS
jgi:putative ABC transport system permease protein